eukprot:NODE_3692_length_933_cov_34.259050_g3393_i0.p1 GENE.NODE_3692_length_933_cov_34.259050_g3393_i0~~NODE_3692_length_933_cov_34.259050_g3393_i0.p1  ORF type:complete len:220 (+),score=36.98 NODE_3692_length_933_cov_34.259050_g3393_i0:80-661(+)
MPRIMKSTAAPPMTLGSVAATEARAAAAEFESTPVGTRVQLRNLTARPALNGRVGTIRVYDSANDRYEVEIDGASGLTRIAVRPECLGKITEITISGLQQSPELNGQIAVICSFDPPTGRYQVQAKSSGRILSLRPNNARLKEGALVQLTGFKDSQRDGLWGRVLSADAGKNLYTVRTDGAGDLSVPWSNVRA